MKKQFLFSAFLFQGLLGLSISGVGQELSSSVEGKTYPSDYWQYSHTPLLGQLVPVNQINLQPGIQLLDVEASTKRSEGMINPFDNMGPFGESSSTKNDETTIKLRYAFPISRYFYIGAAAGFANRFEADLYEDTGLMDPEFFTGYHMPWQNGNFRLALTFSPSLGASRIERSIVQDGESAKGNFYRGGMSLRPEAALTLRTGVALLGVEASYLYLTERVQEETLKLSDDVLMNESLMLSLNDKYIGQVFYPYNTFAGQTGFSSENSIRSTLKGGHTWAVKTLIEFPEWYRLGGEFIYGQVDPSTREYSVGSLGKTVEIKGGSFQEVRFYGRYRYSEKFSLTPVLSWMPESPLLRADDRMESVKDIIGFQLTARSKFSL